MDVGEQILELREQKNMPLEELALGVCTPESLRNIELGKETVSKLFMEIMYQRLGKSTDKLELIVSDEVYDEEELWERFEECLERGNKATAEEILEILLQGMPEDSNVHKMFYCRNKAYAELRVGNNPIQAKDWMQKALDITMPGWQKRPLEEYWISTLEMENLLAYAKTQLAIGTQEELDAAERLLTACQSFIDERVTDEEEHAKIFAKCAYLLGNTYLRKKKVSLAEQVATRAFLELQTFGISYFMEPLLKVLIQCQRESTAEKNLYSEYLSALQHVKQFVGEEWRFTDSILKNCSQQTYYIDHELFREERIAQGYSQEEMIEGIYKNPESLSRAERGKVTMRDSRLIRLFKKLGIEKNRYNGFVVTDKYEDLELKLQVDMFINRDCYEEAEGKLEELRNRLDLRVAENRRWIMGYEINIKRENDKVPKEELLQKAVDLLQESYRIRTNGVYRSPMDREVSLINQIGILLLELGRKEEAIQLFYRVTEAMRNSKVSLKKRSRKYNLLRTNLAKWEDSMILAKENIQFTLSCGKLVTLPIDYMTIACILVTDPANKDICRVMIKDVYYLCELAQNNVNKELTRQFYRENFGSDII